MSDCRVVIKTPLGRGEPVESDWGESEILEVADNIQAGCGVSPFAIRQFAQAVSAYIRAEKMGD